MVDITNFSERAIALLAGQFQDKPTPTTSTNLQNLIIAACEPATTIQTQIQDLIYQRSIKTAIGLQLDGLGQILGLARIIGQSDASYREDLIFQIFLNASSGTPEQIIKAAKYFTGASQIWYIDNFPAAYFIESNAPANLYPPNPKDIVDTLQALSPAGVELSALIATYNNLTFSFASDSSNNPFYVVPNPSLPGVQLVMNSGDYLYVEPSAFGNFSINGCFGETGYTNYNCPGAGRFAEAIMG
jgi:hypothetical protein